MYLTIKRTPELLEIIRRKMDSGACSSASEVVHAALHLLSNVDHAQAAKLEQLRQDIRDELSSGPGPPWDREEIKKLGRSRLAAKAGGST